MVPGKTRDDRPIKSGNDDPSIFAGPETVWQSYGVPWANVSDTPFRLYKHFTHEGGISTPFIVSWPKAITNQGGLSQQLGHITDLMPTLLEITGATYPAEFKSKPILPLEGQSLLPTLEGKTAPEHTPIFWEHEGNRAVRSGKWKLVSRFPGAWELYDMDADRTELNNLAAKKLRKSFRTVRRLCKMGGALRRRSARSTSQTRPIAPAPMGETAD